MKNATSLKQTISLSRSVSVHTHVENSLRSFFLPPVLPPPLQREKRAVLQRLRSKKKNNNNKKAKTVEEVVGEEVEAFPETHLVLMQGPGGVDYRHILQGNSG